MMTTTKKKELLVKTQLRSAAWWCRWSLPTDRCQGKGLQGCPPLQRRTGCPPLQRRTGCLMLWAVGEALALPAVLTAGPPPKSLVNHSTPFHSSFLIVVCKALLAGK